MLNAAMSESVEIKIQGKKYTVKSDSFSVDPNEVASLVDTKMQELSGVRGISSSADLAILAALNIAQEFLELKRQAEEAGQESETRLDSLIQILEKEVENTVP